VGNSVRAAAVYPVGQLAGLVAFLAGLWIIWGPGVMLLVGGPIVTAVFILAERYLTPVRAAVPPATDEDGVPLKHVPAHLLPEHLGLMETEGEAT